MKPISSIEEIIKNQLAKKKNESAANADAYGLYKAKNDLNFRHKYVNAVNSLYAAKRKDASSYGRNNRKINNKGLQNSGYAAYIDDLADVEFKRGIEAIRSNYRDMEREARIGYEKYLEDYESARTKLEDSVMNHLVKGGVVDLGTAVAYGMSAGLTREEAERIGQSAYEFNKKSIFNTVLEQTMSLGLDSEGARMLAIKMGVSEEDAQSFAGEIGEMLEYYGSISEDYLEFLENRSN